MNLTRQPESPQARDIASASGHYDLEKRSYQIHADARSLDLRALNLPGGIPVRGVLSMAAAGSGSATDPSLEAKLDLEDLRIGEWTPGHLLVDARMKEHSVEVGIQAPDLNTTVSGTLGMRPPYAARMELLARGMSLDRLGLEVASATPLQGVLSGRIAASGNLREWQQAQADARIETLHIAIKDRTIANRDPIRIGLADGMLNIDQLVLADKGGEIRISGSAPLFDRERTGRLDLAGKVDLAAALDLLPPESGLSIAGLADFAASISGKRDAARVEGTVRLRGASFASSQLPVPLTQIEADARLQDGVLHLDRAQGKLADGTVSGSGSMPLGWFAKSLPFRFEAAEGVSRLTLNLAGLSVAALPGSPAGLTGTVGLHVEAEAPRPALEAVKAEIRLDQLDLAFDPYRLAQSAPSVIVLDGGVARIRQFSLIGTGTNLQADGSVEVAGANAVELRVRGRVEAGLIALFSRRFAPAAKSAFRWM